MDKKLRLCLVGFGNSAQEFCRLLLTKERQIQTDFSQKVLITGIVTASKGNLLNVDGLDIQKALEDIGQYGKFHSSFLCPDASDALKVIKESRADVLIELSPLTTNGQPAIKYIETAFDQNMHVITANKGPIAWDFQRLSSLAKAKHLQFLYETTVMDGTPIFNLAKYTLPGCKVIGFKGILNSTTNFILEEMEKGLALGEAVKEAQKRGFAEADPSFDLDGWDAAYKTAALINVLMDGKITPKEISRCGISHLKPMDLLKAKEFGKRIKLVCEATVDMGKACGIVHPVYIDLDDSFAHINSTSSVLSIATDLMGEVQIIEKNPEIMQTGYGIYSDLLTLIKTIDKQS